MAPARPSLLSMGIERFDEKKKIQIHFHFEAMEWNWSQRNSPNWIAVDSIWFETIELIGTN